MASLDDPEVFNKLGPGFVAVVLAVVANFVTHNIWWLTNHRHYTWVVGSAVVVTYALLFAFHLRGPSAGLPPKDFLIVHVVAILMVWGWADAAFRIINCGLDRSAPTDVTAQVVGFPIRKGTFLKLSAASAFKNVEFPVETDVEQNARLGISVLVTWHKGALGDGWCRSSNAVRIVRP